MCAKNENELRAKLYQSRLRYLQIIIMRLRQINEELKETMRERNISDINAIESSSSDTE